MPRTPTPSIPRPIADRSGPHLRLRGSVALVTGAGRGIGQVAEGRGAEPADAVELIVRLSAGDADSLSGRHISVHDDLDALLARVQEVRSRDLCVLRPEPLIA